MERQASALHEAISALGPQQQQRLEQVGSGVQEQGIT